MNKNKKEIYTDVFSWFFCTMNDANTVKISGVWPAGSKHFLINILDQGC